MSVLERASHFKTIKILLFASQNLIKESLQALIESTNNISVVASTTETSMMPKLVEMNQPDLILLYLLEEETKSVEIIPELQKSISEPYILALTKESDLANQSRALQLGAIRTIQIDKDADELLETIRQICAGMVSPDLRTRAVQPFKNNSAKHSLAASSKQKANLPDQGEPSIYSLTEREREIVGMVGEGLRNKEIAEKLQISKSTVRHHLSSIYDKLNIKDKLNLVIFSYRNKLTNSFHNEG